MAQDTFQNYAPQFTGPALGASSITPSDVTDLSVPIRAVTINSGGAISFVDRKGNTHVTGNLPVGTYPLVATRINATGTTASQITGWI